MAFDDAGEPVQAVAFQYPQDEPQELSASERQEILCRLLQFLTGGRAKAKQIGQRVLLLSHLVSQSGCRTQRELARRLGVKESRASQSLKVARREFAMLARGLSSPPEKN